MIETPSFEKECHAMKLDLRSSITIVDRVIKVCRESQWSQQR